MDNGYVFVSIVGTQIMGTIQPLMAFVQKFGPVEAFLLYTHKTAGLAEKIKAVMEERQFGKAELLFVENRLDVEGGAPAQVVRLAEKAEREGRRVCFNLDGGYNYMASGCVIALEPFKPLFIQASHSRALLYDTRSGIYAALPLPDELPIETVLALQGVEYEIQRSNPGTLPKGQESLDKLLKKARLAFPENSLRNVRLEDMFVDCVWNAGNNRIVFFKDCRVKETEREDKLRDRDFAEWSMNRKRIKELYDKEVIAVVSDDASHNRIEANSNAKIRVFPVKAFNAGKPAQKEALLRLQRLFEKARPEPESQLSMPEKSALPPMRDNTLVVCVGTNLMPTLKVIASHKPRHLLLCCNDNDPVVPVYASNIAKYKDELGLESVTLANYPIEGDFTEERLPESAGPDCRIMVNITPGTKGQTGMLSLWAGRHGFEVWSLERSGCSPIANVPADSNIPLDMCDPVTALKIMGKRVLDEGQEITALEKDAKWIEAFLEFMRRLKKKDSILFRDFRKLLWERQYVKVPGGSLRSLPGHRWRLVLDGTEHIINRGKGGFWYEKVVAYALGKAGGEKIRMNVKLGWDEANERAISRNLKPGQEIPHMAEVDAIGLLEGEIVHMYVKSYALREKKFRQDDFTLDKALTDAAGSAANHGRFALPIIVDMGSAKSRSLRDAEQILGWPEICDPEEMKNSIRNFRKNKSTNN